jgi:hypothetical protein
MRPLCASRPFTFEHASEVLPDEAVSAADDGERIHQTREVVPKHHIRALPCDIRPRTRGNATIYYRQR